MFNFTLLKDHFKVNHKYSEHDNYNEIQDYGEYLDSVNI